MRTSTAKKWLSLLLTLVMVVTAAPLAGFAGLELFQTASAVEIVEGEKHNRKKEKHMDLSGWEQIDREETMETMLNDELIELIGPDYLEKHDDFIQLDKGGSNIYATDLSGLYHYEILDTDADGEVELIAFAVVRDDQNDDGGESYSLAVIGCDVLSDQEAVSTVCWPDSCNTALFDQDQFDQIQVGGSFWAGVKDHYIAVVSESASQDSVMALWENLRYQLYSFVDGKFCLETDLELYQMLADDNLCGCSTEGFEFETVINTNEANQYINKIRDSLPSDYLFPFTVGGEMTVSGPDDDIHLSMFIDEEEDVTTIEVIDATPYFDLEPIGDWLDPTEPMDVLVTFHDPDYAERVVVDLECDGVEIVDVETGSAFKNMQKQSTEGKTEYLFDTRGLENERLSDELCVLTIQFADDVDLEFGGVIHMWLEEYRIEGEDRLEDSDAGISDGYFSLYTGDGDRQSLLNTKAFYDLTDFFENFSSYEMYTRITDISFDLDEMEDLSGVYHEEFADTDGDGEEELIVFLIVPDHNEDGEEFYSLLIYGCDISENGIPVSGWYWSDWCNTAALNDYAGELFSFYAAVKGQNIALVSWESPDEPSFFGSDYIYTLLTFSDGNFEIASEIELFTGVSDDKDVCICFTDDYAFESEPETAEARANISKLRSALPGDLLFPLDNDGYSADVLIDMDIYLDVGLGRIDVMDRTPLMTLAEQDGAVLNVQEPTRTVDVPVVLFDPDCAERIIVEFECEGVEIVNVTAGDEFETMLDQSKDGKNRYLFHTRTTQDRYVELCTLTLGISDDVNPDFGFGSIATWLESYQVDSVNRIDDCDSDVSFGTVDIIDAPPAQSGLRGDANLDGKVLANDARLVLRASAKLETLEGQAFINCDLNGDGKLLAGEARKILRYSAKLESEL